MSSLSPPRAVAVGNKPARLRTSFRGPGSPKPFRASLPSACGGWYPTTALGLDRIGARAIAPARRPVPFRGPGGGRAGLIGRLWKARASEKRENPLSSEPGNRTVAAVAGRTSGRRRWRVVAAVVLFLVGSLLLLQATKVGDGGDAAGHPESAAGFGHIHGIGVNPADGRVYVGTHRGVFQVSEQQSPVLVSDRVQDFMGFTVVGPDHFLAGGHPGDDSSASVGLIESTDAGATWTSRSLDGRADFHSLQARHGFVYGYDYSTRELMVTADLEVWDTRSHVRLGDFAVSPANPDVVVGVTDRGVVRSQDGGRSFTAPAGPVLLLVSWAEDGALVGVTPCGVVHASGDGGLTWDTRGTLNGLAEAVEAISGREIYAAADSAVLVSKDGGRTFAALTTEGASAPLEGCTHSGHVHGSATPGAH